MHILVSDLGLYNAKHVSTTTGIIAILVNKYIL
jgi:hypothetical protein